MTNQALSQHTASILPATPTVHPQGTFLGLPGELRNAIYDYVFEHVWSLAHLQPLLTCRQVYHESKDKAYYEMATQTFTIGHDHPPAREQGEECEIEKAAARYNALRPELQNKIHRLKLHTCNSLHNVFRIFPRLPPLILLTQKAPTQDTQPRCYGELPRDLYHLKSYIASYDDECPFLSGEADGGKVDVTIMLSPELRYWEKLIEQDIGRKRQLVSEGFRSTLRLANEYLGCYGPSYMHRGRSGSSYVQHQIVGIGNDKCKLVYRSHLTHNWTKWTRRIPRSGKIDCRLTITIRDM